MRCTVERAWAWRGWRGEVLRWTLSPASLAYRAGLAVSLGARRRRPWDRAVPVVLVGNITVGGTGKTPLVADIAGRMLAERARIGVVSRGYGGRRGAAPAVVSGGDRAGLDAVRAGDEPWLLARALPGIPVVVGADRVAAAERAVALGAEVLVADDAFQQRGRFPRGFRVVTVNAADPFGNGALLPAGPLREPVTVLREAGAVVLTHVSEAGTEEVARLRSRLEELCPGRPVASTRHELGGVTAFPGREPVPEGWIEGRRVLALAAIGYPEGFRRSLSAATGVEVACLFERDHHRWRTSDLARAASLAAARGCEAIVTTEKDAARLPAGIPAGVKMLVAGLKLAWVGGEEEFRTAMLRHLGIPEVRMSPGGRPAPA